MISTQHVEEDPEQYIAQITNYMEKSASAESFVIFNDEDNAIFNESYQQQIHSEDAEQAKERVKQVASICGLRWASKIQNFHLKNTWINGLMQPYADIARAQDKDKPLGDLIDKVQDEGAAKIHRCNFKYHASTMRAYQQSNKHSANRIHMVERVHTGDDAPETQQSADNVTAAMAQPKFCRYCKKK